MANGEKTFTKGGNMRAPKIAVVTSWVKEAWDEIAPEIIVRAFKKCGISCKLDGTEDDAIFDDWEDADEEDADEPDIIDEMVYDDMMTEEDFDKLFEESDNSDVFEGF